MNLTQHGALLCSCLLFLLVAPSQANGSEDYFNLRGLTKPQDIDSRKLQGPEECPCGKCQDFSEFGLMETKPCVDWSTISNELRNNQWGDATCATNTCRGCCRAYTWLKCDESGHTFPYIPCICNERTQDPNNFKPITRPPIYIPSAGQGKNNGCPDDKDDKDKDKNKNNKDNDKDKDNKNGNSKDDQNSGKDDNQTPPTDPNLVQVAETTGDFNIFLGLLEDTGMTSVLEDTGSTYTVFGPTDSAWPQGAQLDFFMDVLDAESKSTLVDYHIIPGLLSPFQLTHGAELVTLQGKTLLVTIDHVNGITRFNGKDLIRAGIQASNGVLYEMDGFFVP